MALGPLMYIDPGTGSMLFTVLIGVLTAAVYFFRKLWIRVRFMLSGGRRGKEAENHIPFLIFTDDKRYWNTFRPLCEEMDRRGENVVYWTASPDDPALKESFEHVRAEFIGEGNRAFARMGMADADVVLSSTPGLDVYQWKRSRAVSRYVHIPHMATDLTTYRMYGLDYYDSVMLTGPYQEEPMRKLEAMRKLPPKELPLVGVLYMDEMRRRLLAAEPLPEHPVTVLLAPSWGPSGILRRYGGDIIEALLKTSFRLIIRPHPQSFTSEKELMDDLMSRYPDSEQLHWDRSNDNFETLRRSDVLISDFSGVILDFALVFDGPVICADTDFDKSVYDAWFLKEELWILSRLDSLGPRLTRESLPEIGSLVQRCLSESVYREGREQVRRECWANVDHGAEKAADYLQDLRSRVLAEKTGKEQEK